MEFDSYPLNTRYNNTDHLAFMHADMLARYGNQLNWEHDDLVGERLNLNGDALGSNSTGAEICLLIVNSHSSHKYPGSG